MKLPKARTESLIEQNLDKETLIYDLNTHKAFNLNETSTIVYRACTNGVTFDELKHKHQFNDDFIFLALDELKKNNLLADDYQSPINVTNRREIIKRVGLASMIMLPMITGLIAPTAANAASNTANTNSSGGSIKAGDPGTYNQVCLTTVSGGQYIDYCYAGLECGNTSRGNRRCCERSPGVALYHYSGESVSTPIEPGSPYYFPIDSAPTTSADCGGVTIRCCDGSRPTGTCTYTRYQGEDGGDYDDPGPILGLYFRTCDCACP